MKKMILKAALILTGLTVGIVASAQNKSADLTYRYSSGKPVTYVTTTKMHEVMDVNGQAMDVYVTGFLSCTVKAAGNAGKNLNLDIRIDSLSEVVDTPQGIMGGTVTDVAGKSFSLALKPTGKVADPSGAKALVYSLPGQGSNNMASSFAEFFPVLPGQEVTAGYNWNSVDTVSSEEGVNSQVTVTNSQNKVDGFEEMLGINCAKITSTTAGTSVMNNEIQGMKMITKGNFTGTVVTWFDTTTGSLVKSESISRMTGQMDMTNEGYSFPVVIDITETTGIRE